MPYLCRDKHIEHDINWYNNKNKPEEIKECCSEFTVGLKIFYFQNCVKADDEYTLIYGYYCAFNYNYIPRIWYKSQSEDIWRAFIGFTSGNKFEKKGGGANTKGGYIIEAIACNELQEGLGEFLKIQEVQDKCFQVKEKCPFDQGFNKLNLEILNYYRGTSQYSKSQINKEFAKEREYKDFILPESVDENTKAILQQTSNVEIQKGYKIKDNKRIGVGHNIKKTVDLWSQIIETIGEIEKEGIKLAVKEHFHEILKVNYLVNTYEINSLYHTVNPPLVLELANTKSIMHNYNGYLGLREISTPIVWIRNVYIKNSDITSFGTYRQIPINLAFLVQKPCDYVMQTSLSYRKIMNIKMLNENYANFNQKGIYHKGIYHKGEYMSMSLLNEATSSIIKQFKIMNNMPLFSGKYRFNDMNSMVNGKAWRKYIIDVLNNYLTDNECVAIKQLRNKFQEAESTGEVEAFIYYFFVIDNNYSNYKRIFTSICQNLLSSFVNMANNEKLTTETASNNPLLNTSYSCSHIIKGPHKTLERMIAYIYVLAGKSKEKSPLKLIEDESNNLHKILKNENIICSDYF